MNPESTIILVLLSLYLFLIRKIVFGCGIGEMESIKADGTTGCIGSLDTDYYCRANNAKYLARNESGINNKYYYDGVLKMCIQECDSDNPYTKNGNQCTDDCGSDYTDVIANICTDKCTGSAYPTGSGLNKKCEAQCKNDKYGKKDPNGNSCVNECPGDLYAKESPKECVDKCLDETFPVTESGKKKCASKCKDNKYGLLDSNGNSCVDNCGSLYKKDDSTNGNRCVEKCEGELYGTEEGSDKKCVAKCPDDTYGMKYDTGNLCITSCTDDYYANSDSNTCVLASDCGSSNYALTDASGNKCVSECTGEVFATKDASNVNRCVTAEECKSKYALTDPSGNRCVVNCSPLYGKTTGSVNTCVNNLNDPYFCVNSDNNIQDSNSPLAYYYTDSASSIKYCLTNCNSTYPFLQTNNEECVTDCTSSGKANYISDTENKCIDFSGSETYYCFDSENNTVIATTTTTFKFNVDDGNQKNCMTACTGTYPYEYNTNQCVGECPDDYYIRNHQTCENVSASSNSSYACADLDSKEIKENSEADSYYYVYDGFKICIPTSTKCDAQEKKGVTYHYIKSDEGICVVNCPSNYYIEPVSNDCKTTLQNDPYFCIDDDDTYRTTATYDYYYNNGTVKKCATSCPPTVSAFTSYEFYLGIECVPSCNNASSLYYFTDTADGDKVKCQDYHGFDYYCIDQTTGYYKDDEGQFYFKLLSNTDIKFCATSCSVASFEGTNYNFYNRDELECRNQCETGKVIQESVICLDQCDHDGPFNKLTHYFLEGNECLKVDQNTGYYCANIADGIDLWHFRSEGLRYKNTSDSVWMCTDSCLTKDPYFYEYTDSICNDTCIYYIVPTSLKCYKPAEVITKIGDYFCVDTSKSPPEYVMTRPDDTLFFYVASDPKDPGKTAKFCTSDCSTVTADSHDYKYLKNEIECVYECTGEYYYYELDTPLKCLTTDNYSDYECIDETNGTHAFSLYSVNHTKYYTYDDGKKYCTFDTSCSNEPLGFGTTKHIYEYAKDSNECVYHDACVDPYYVDSYVMECKPMSEFPWGDSCFDVTTVSTPTNAEVFDYYKPNKKYYLRPTDFKPICYSTNPCSGLDVGSVNYKFQIKGTLECVSECVIINDTKNYEYQQTSTYCIDFCEQNGTESTDYFALYSNKTCLTTLDYPGYYCIYRENKTYCELTGTDRPKYYVDETSSTKYKYCTEDCTYDTYLYTKDQYQCVRKIDCQASHLYYLLGNDCLSLSESEPYYCIDKSNYTLQKTEPSDGSLKWYASNDTRGGGALTYIKACTPECKDIDPDDCEPYDCNYLEESTLQCMRLDDNEDYFCINQDTMTYGHEDATHPYFFHIEGTDVRHCIANCNVTHQAQEHLIDLADSRGETPPASYPSTPERIYYLDVNNKTCMTKAEKFPLGYFCIDEDTRRFLEQENNIGDPKFYFIYPNLSMSDPQDMLCTEDCKKVNSNYFVDVDHIHCVTIPDPEDYYCIDELNNIKGTDAKSTYQYIYYLEDLKYCAKVCTTDCGPFCYANDTIDTCVPIDDYEGQYHCLENSTGKYDFDDGHYYYWKETEVDGGRKVNIRYCISTCSSNYTLNIFGSKECVHECADGYWETSDHKYCKLCDISCITCVTTEKTCKVCNDTYFFYLENINDALGPGICIQHSNTTKETLCFYEKTLSPNREQDVYIPRGDYLYYVNINGTHNGDTEPLNLCALTCKDITVADFAKENETSTLCVRTCADGRYFKHFVLDSEDNFCEVCVDKCKTCLPPGDICTSCDNRDYFGNADNPDDCVTFEQVGFDHCLDKNFTFQNISTFPWYYFENSSVSTLPPAIDSIQDHYFNIRICEEATKCQSRSQINETDYLFSDTNECSTECPFGYYKDSSSSKCVSCNLTDHCGTCSSSLSGKCLTCSEPEYFLSSSKCYLYPNLPSNTCVNVLDKKALTTTSTNYYYLNDNQENICLTNCLQIGYLTLSDSKKCVRKCPKGYFTNDSGNCTKCSQHCATCDRAIFCLTCEDGYYPTRENDSFCGDENNSSMYNTYCFNNNTKEFSILETMPYYIDGSKKYCVDICPNVTSKQLFLNYPNNLKCVENCQDGYYGSIEYGNVCRHCGKRCTKCSNNPDNCDLCNNNYIDENGKVYEFYFTEDTHTCITFEEQMEYCFNETANIFQRKGENEVRWQYKNRTVGNETLKIMVCVKRCEGLHPYILRDSNDRCLSHVEASIEMLKYCANKVPGMVDEIPLEKIEDKDGNKRNWFLDQPEPDVIVQFCTDKCMQAESKFNFTIEETGQCTLGCNVPDRRILAPDLILYNKYFTCVYECPNIMKNDEGSLDCKMHVQGTMQDFTVDENSNAVYSLADSSCKAITDEEINIVKGLSDTLKMQSMIIELVGSNTKYTLTYLTRGTEQGLIGSTFLKSKGCIDKIKEENQLSDSEDLIVSQLFCAPDSSTIPTQIQRIFLPNGQEIEESVCAGFSYNEYKPLDPQNDDIHKQLIELQKELDEIGVNVFDSGASVFGDICSTATGKNGGLSFKERRKILFEDFSICSISCSPVKLEVDKNDGGTVECICGLIDEGESTSFLEENEIFATIVGFIQKSNFVMFSCFKNIFEFNRYSGNYGHWSMIVSGSAIVALIVIFYIRDLPLLLSFMNKFLHPPKKRRVTSQYSEALSGNESKSKFGSQSKKKLAGSISSSFDLKAKPNKNNDEKLQPEELVLPKKSGINTAGNEDKAKQNVILRIKKAVYHPEDGEQDENYTADELNSMEYEDALAKDKRKCGQYILDNLTEKQIILSAIFKGSIFYPLELRMIMLLFNFSAFFFFNGMFCTEKAINERKKSGKTLDIMYIISNEMANSVYSSLLGTVLGKLLRIVTSVQVDFYKIVRITRFRCKNSEYRYKSRKLHDIFRTLQSRLVITFGCIISALFVFWYFLTIFCGIFPEEQVSWVQGSCISITLNILLVCGVVGFAGPIKYYGIKTKTK